MNKTAFKQAVDSFVEVLKQNAAEVGIELKTDAAEIAKYTHDRALALSQEVGEPGFGQALTAERDNLALFASEESVTQADKIDARFLSLAQGGLAALASVAAALI